MGLEPGNAEVTWIAETQINLDKENAESMLKLQGCLRMNVQILNF